MTEPKPTPARRSALLPDLRIILLGSWAFLLQLFCPWRLTPKLVERPHDDQHTP